MAECLSDSFNVLAFVINYSAVTSHIMPDMPDKLLDSSALGRLRPGGGGGGYSDVVWTGVRG